MVYIRPVVGAKTSVPAFPNFIPRFATLDASFFIRR